LFIKSHKLHRKGPIVNVKEVPVRKKMHYSARFFALSFLICFSVGLAGAAQKAYTMKGNIKYVDISHHTVGIDVPLGHGKFRVAGPLSQDTVLQKGKKTASLADFKPGDFVTVRWKATKSGHIVLGLFQN